jgi:hypothetical protein
MVDYNIYNDYLTRRFYNGKFYRGGLSFECKYGVSFDYIECSKSEYYTIEKKCILITINKILEIDSIRNIKNITYQMISKNQEYELEKIKNEMIKYFPEIYYSQSYNNIFDFIKEIYKVDGLKIYYHKEREILVNQIRNIIGLKMKDLKQQHSFTNEIIENNKMILNEIISKNISFFNSYLITSDLTIAICNIFEDMYISLYKSNYTFIITNPEKLYLLDGGFEE